MEDCDVKDPQGYFQNKAVKAIKQNRQGVLVSFLKLLHHLFVSHVRLADNGDVEGGSRRFGSNLVIHGSTPSMRPMSAGFLHYNMPPAARLCTKGKFFYFGLAGTRCVNSALEAGTDGGCVPQITDSGDF